MTPFSPCPPAILTPDLCIVGAGYAGLAVATGAAALGVPAVVFERAAMGDALPRAGDIARLVLRDAARRHRLDPSSGLDWDALKAEAAAAARLRTPAMSAAHLRALGVAVIEATARFRDRDTIEAGGTTVQPRRIVLATGAVPLIPSLPGLDAVPWSQAEHWIDLPSLPGRLIVLGAGRTGVEMAQIFSRLGSTVTLVDGATPLRGFDEELCRPVLARLRREGIGIVAGRAVLRAEPDRGGIRLVLAGRDGGEEAVSADRLLVATGRRPALDGLGLDRAGIGCDPLGIAVRADGRTRNRSVFALGDAVGRGRSIEASEAQAGVVLRAALLRQPAAFDPRGVPRLLCTDPEIAVVGLGEDEARGRFGRIDVWRWPFAENGRAQALGIEGGHIKVVTEKSGRIVGAGIVGPEASEMIGLWTLAVAQGLGLKQIASLPLPAGAYADLSRRVAMRGAFSRLDNPWLKRALKAVRWLG